MVVINVSILHEYVNNAREVFDNSYYLLSNY